MHDRSQWSMFAQALAGATGQCFDEPQALQRWSVEHYRDFWDFLLQGCREPLDITGESEPVCLGEDCEHARFFPQLRLNYAHSLLNLAVAGADAPALTACHADRPPTRWTRGQLRRQVERLAAGLARAGVAEGDRVVAVLRNDDLAVIAALAVAALGATLSTASPEMGVQAVLDRFGPLAPRLLITHLAPRPQDTGASLPARVQAIAQGLPTLRSVLRLDEGELDGSRQPWRVLSLDDCLADGEDAPAGAWRYFGFNHPLFIMFSSGTTGRPKCIVHGAGGSLLEHVKEHRLHTDLRPGERMYFHTSCSWMMWNWQLSALASGVEILTYDGPIDSVDRLWRLVAEQRVNVFGTSPAYLRMSQQAQLAPGRQFDLSALRAILSTGAVLYDNQFHWVREQVAPVPLQSISGGTDILGCFVLGHPDRPVVPGEAQCRSLGMDVQAWEGGRPAEGIGELVCANPFPSRPLGFYGDGDGSRFHAAYFARNPGVWTHGDLIEFSAEGGARLHGRCDGLINVRGIKFAPGEVCRVLDEVPGIRESMVVERRDPEAEPTVLALVVAAPGTVVDGELIARLRRAVAATLSSAHVPDRFLAVPELPVTHSGKLSEAAARCAASGQPVENEAALRNPQCLAAIRQAATARERAPADLQGQGLVERLQGLWESLLGVPGIAPEDNFFELGGNSLLAVRLLAQVQQWTGRALPLGTLVQAPTIAQLADLLETGAELPASSLLVRMRAGRGRPLFLVHGLSGTIMECWRLVGALRTPRPVYGLQAQGIDGEEAPQQRVQDMAALYIAQMRSVQPAGPYSVCGFSFGGLVAVEIARQLHAAGEAMELLCLLDPHLRQGMAWANQVHSRGLRVARKLAHMPAQDMGHYLAGTLTRVVDEARVRAGLLPRQRPSQALGLAPVQQQVYDQLLAALSTYRPQPYEGGPIVYVRASAGLDGYFDPVPVWKRIARSGLQVVEIPGGHLELVGANAQRVAQAIDAALGSVRPEPFDDAQDRRA